MHVLIINNLGLGMGGITTHMYSYLEQIRKQNSNINIDIVSTMEANDKMLEKFKSIGCNIIFLAHRKKNLFKYFNELRQLMKKNSYDVVHVHGNSATMIIDLWWAFYNNVPVRIAHCHNSTSNHKTFTKIMKPVFSKMYTRAIACSELAGNWIFGKDKFEVLHNAINLKEYTFCKEKRDSIRDELGITNEYVIGHIGLFNEQKNHEKIFQVVSCLKKSINVKLICVSGDESIPKEIREMIEKYDLKDNVKILLRRTDVNRILQAFDFFIFPSKFEGFGIAFVEAQASGLYCLVSDNVPISAGVCKNLVNYMSLSKDEKEWASLILDYKNTKSKEREALSMKAINDLRTAGYDTIYEANKLRKIYMD